MSSSADSLPAMLSTNTDLPTSKICCLPPGAPSTIFSFRLWDTTVGILFPVHTWCCTALCHRLYLAATQNSTARFAFMCDWRSCLVSSIAAVSSLDLLIHGLCSSQLLLLHINWLAAWKDCNVVRLLRLRSVLCMSVRPFLEPSKAITSINAIAIVRGRWRVGDLGCRNWRQWVVELLCKLRLGCMAVDLVW